MLVIISSYIVGKLHLEAHLFIELQGWFVIFVYIYKYLLQTCHMNMNFVRHVCHHIQNDGKPSCYKRQKVHCNFQKNKNHKYIFLLPLFLNNMGKEMAADIFSWTSFFMDRRKLKGRNEILFRSVESSWVFWVYKFCKHCFVVSVYNHVFIPDDLATLMAKCSILLAIPRRRADLVTHKFEIYP